MSEAKPNRIKILSFVGLTGSGKSSAVDYVASRGFPKIYFGGVVYDEMNRRNIEITPESQQKFREEWRAQEGNDVVANKVIEQANNLIQAGQHNILLDSIYSWDEYKAMKRAFPGSLTVVAIILPKRIRYQRLANRPERPFTQEEAKIRDWSEIENLDKGGPIAIADHYIRNDSTPEALREQIDQILGESFVAQN